MNFYIINDRKKPEETRVIFIEDGNEEEKLSTILEDGNISVFKINIDEEKRGGLIEQITVAQFTEEDADFIEVEREYL